MPHTFLQDRGLKHVSNIYWERLTVTHDTLATHCCLLYTLFGQWGTCSAQATTYFPVRPLRVDVVALPSQSVLKRGIQSDLCLEVRSRINFSEYALRQYQLILDPDFLFITMTRADLTKQRPEQVVPVLSCSFFTRTYCFILANQSLSFCFHANFPRKPCSYSVALAGTCFPYLPFV